MPSATGRGTTSRTGRMLGVLFAVFMLGGLLFIVSNPSPSECEQEYAATVRDGRLPRVFDPHLGAAVTESKAQFIANCKKPLPKGLTP